MSNHTIWDVMDDICAWLRANGIEPNQVPEAAVPVVTDGRITVPVFLLNEHGHKYQVDGEPARGEQTVPLVQSPPAVLDDWLAGKLPVR